MSGREWQPGDVFTGRIMSANRETFYVIEVTANSRAAWGEGVHAVNADGNGYLIGSIKDKRPLGVIDPEDREQVERLWALFRDTAHDDARDGMQAALREFANPTPPTPDEPTGLGAVVEGADGRIWVRTDMVALAYMHWREVDGKNVAKWSGIDAVRILSEGVTVDA